MDITYLGHSSFRIKGKQAVVVTDPYVNDTGLKYPKHVTADVVTVSHDHQDHNDVSQIEGTPFVVKGPGEYEIKGVGIVGVRAYHDDKKGEERGGNTIYRIEVDGVSVVHLGDLGHMLTTSQVEDLGEVDVLLIPVGGIYTIDAAKAVEVINELEPSIVVPMHYHRPELDTLVFKDIEPLSAFLKAIGKEEVPPQQKLTVTKDKLPPEMQVVVLE